MGKLAWMAACAAMTILARNSHAQHGFAVTRQDVGSAQCMVDVGLVPPLGALLRLAAERWRIAG